ncbi:MAG: DNA polymerase I [Bacteroidetes bacterium]|nr:DNA polymerase I [Bacteroidota bacterium]
MPENKKLFLLDAMALIYRAYFALNKNPRISSKGQNTSAILGFANSLYDVLKNENPTHIGVAFDTFAPTVRTAEFTEYKANREAMPEDIASALPYIDKLIQGFNIPILAVDGYEADDVIGTLAKKAEAAGFQVYMVTPDKDFGQLVSENIRMYKPPRMGNKAEILGVKEICEKYGIERPEQFIDILGLWGDASDNIPGVPNVGEKTAIKLVKEFGSVEELLRNTGRLSGKLKENVEQYAEQALISKQLATIILDVPVEFDEKSLKRKDPDAKALKALFEELEFRTFASRLFTDLRIEAESRAGQADLFSDLSPEESGLESSFTGIRDTKHRYILVEKPEERQTLLGELKYSGGFCFDTESTGLDVYRAELVGISFCMQPGTAYFLILPEEKDEVLRILEEYKPLFEDSEIEKTGQNLKYDISLLKQYGVETRGFLFDTMLAHYLIEPDLRHNMNFMAETYLGYRPVPIEELIGKKGKGQSSMREVERSLLRDYACEDADITLQLRNVFEPMLQTSGAMKLFREVEVPLIPVLADMEAEGVRLDTAALNEFSGELQKEIEATEYQIYELAGSSFNISSPKQLGEILFDRLNIADNPKKTKTKQYSTGEEILSKLVTRHPIVQLILDYRSLTKLKSTYVDTLPSMTDENGRIHTSFNQAVAATGRLSSNNPNLQNIPIRTEKGREIRKAFVPRDENHVLLAADYSQIELRIIAELSGDTAMMETFQRGEDIHTATAARVYGVSLSEVTQEMRRNAKTVNFGIVYGISAFGLSERLAIPRREAGDIIDQYFRKYPGIKNYMNDTIAFARENGYVSTILGRRRYLRDINSNNATVRGFAERNAINAPIQGSSADMIKIAMIRIHQAIQDEKLQARMILQVHDELVFDTPLGEVERVTELTERLMKTAIPMKVPVEVEINTGRNWLEAH